MQVLSVNRAPTADCINVEIGYEENLAVALPSEVKATQQAIQLIQFLMPLTKRIIKATLCLSEEDAETHRRRRGGPTSVARGNRGD